MNFNISESAINIINKATTIITGTTEMHGQVHDNTFKMEATVRSGFSLGFSLYINGRPWITTSATQEELADVWEAAMRKSIELQEVATYEHNVLCEQLTC